MRLLLDAMLSPRRTKDDVGRIVEALEEKLAAYPGPDDLANAREWL